MKFDTPARTNPIDQLKVVGQPYSRIEGPLKTTGTAPYAYERHDVFEDPAYGYAVPAGIPKGRIRSIDDTAARGSSGVLAIVTAANAGPVGRGPGNTAKLLGGPEIEHYHQAVAIVVAETFEQARSAAALVKIDYEEEAGNFDLAAARTSAPAELFATRTGDFEKAFAAAPIQIDSTYTTPDQSHCMMEPHASMAAWDGGRLTVWTSNQMIARGRQDLAQTLGLDPANVRLVSPFVGGGFGAKLALRSDAVLAAIGARAAGRPVKVALTRPVLMNNTTHRPATIQRIRIGTENGGRILAIGHESWSGNLPGGGPENAVGATRLLYAGKNRLTAMRLAELDLPEGNSMRAPGEAPGLMALEVAIDEAAEKARIDPVRFRIINDTRVDPEHPARPFSQRRLVECLKLGAERFGWSARKAPGAVRNGRWLVGLGVAAAFRNSITKTSGALVRLDKTGQILVETDMTDIGTGSYTIIAQTAAEMMGVPLHQVSVRLGDSRYPVSAGSGGQFGASNSTSGVYAACVRLREAVAQKVGIDSNEARFVDGQIIGGGIRVPLATVAQAEDIVAEDSIEYGDLDQKYQESTFGAHFVEVGVDSATGEIRVHRMLAVCDAGRILNPKTARSQVIGAMTMGVGGALMENLVVDKKRGFFVNHDLAGYEVPVHADIPHQDVVLLQGADPIANPMKAKGLGELGLCGVAAAIANAVYNATGVRVREYPVTLDKLIPHMPVSA
jgi:xanthine dehydrogenase YagR molybdenum-binding subunit